MRLFCPFSPSTRAPRIDNALSPAFFPSGRRAYLPPLSCSLELCLFSMPRARGLASQLASQSVSELVASIAERERSALLLLLLVLSARSPCSTNRLVGRQHVTFGLLAVVFFYSPSLPPSVRHVESFFRVPPSSYWRRAVRVGTNAWSPFLARVDRVVFRGRVERGRVVFRVFARTTGLIANSARGPQRTNKEREGKVLSCCCELAGMKH